MYRLLHFLFPQRPSARLTSVVLLALRTTFSMMFLTHGLKKWEAFETLQNNFPDPIGIGSHFSLMLAIFAEVYCSIALVLGFLHRLILLPMISTMIVAICFIHNGHPFAESELAFAYLLVFVAIYILGVGKYSADYWMMRFYKAFE